MNSIDPARSFEVARRRHLIEATIDTLADVGFKAASLNQIARRAKVSTGLFAHYFGDKDGLLEATLRFVAARLAQSTSLKLRSAATLRERLYAVGDAALADEEFDRRTSAVWLAFWGQMTHSKRYRRVQHIYQRRMISNLKDALRGLVPQERVGSCAVLIAATIDGLWLRSHVSGPAQGADAPDTDGARILVRSLIDGLLAGVDAAGPSALPGPSSRAGLPVQRSPDHGPFEDEEAAGRPPGRADAAAQTAAEARRGLARWSASPAPERAEVLRRCADMLRSEGPALARLESRETGRPVRATAGADLAEAVAALDRAAKLAADMRAVRVELPGGRVGECRCRPGRLVATSVHWSRPVLDACLRMHALAFGDALLVDAGRHAGETVRRLAAVFARAGLPEGTLSVVDGGPGAMRSLAGRSDRRGDDPIPRLRSGTDEAASFGRAGPKAATVVLPGADLERAASSILSGCRAWTGSTFSSQNRIYVHETVRRSFTEALAAAAATLRVGDPLAEETQVGRLLSRHQGDWIAALLKADLDAGSRLVAGGQGLPPGAPDDSVWLRPLVVDGCGAGSALVRADTFAPVVTLLRFDEEATPAALSRADGPTAIGLFSGEAESGVRLASMLDRPLCFVNDDGLAGAPGWGMEDRSDTASGPLPPPFRRIVVSDQRTHRRT